MKKGEIVRLIESPDAEWMEEYRERLFEVQEVYKRRCLVRMLGVPNPERYWFTEIENFKTAKEEDSGH
jgi:hypothetical protein